jgi:hypothetical protein
MKVPARARTTDTIAATTDMARHKKKLRKGARTRTTAGVGFESPGTFDAAFFSSHLRALVRDRCPNPDETMPAVAIHLATDDVLEVCHVIGLAATWFALAVYDKAEEGGARSMRTELVPYAAIMRITIWRTSPGIPRIGFDPDHPPVAIEKAAGDTGAEQLLRMVGPTACAASSDQSHKPRRPSP